jgi:signal peptidase II
MVLTVKDYALLAVFVALDQITKVVAILTKPNNLLFEFAWNTGAGFGILPGYNWLFLLISLFVLGLIFKPMQEAKGWEKTAYVMLAAGILGNSIDRVIHQKVADFISIGSFPIFNVADSLICVSIAFLVVQGAYELHAKKH